VPRLGTWRVRLAEPSLAAALESPLTALAHGEDPAGAEIVKRTRLRDVLRIALGEAITVIVKRDRKDRARWHRSNAAREYANLRRVRAAGLPAVEPLAVLERRVRGGRDARLVTRAAPAAATLAEHLREADVASAQALLDRAAALVRRLHEAGFWHRDLHAGNLLLSRDELLLVDLAKLRRLPFAPPLALRARDLAGLVGDGRPGRVAHPRRLAEAYAAAAPDGPDALRLAGLVERASERAARTRLRSRERRCVVASSGFRSERRGALRILRRADVTAGAALAAAQGARAEASVRLPDVAGGPPPGPAPDPFGRGQGAPESGAPALAPACLRAFASGLGVVAPLGLAHPGLRAWRLSHALLLRGVDTPAPLALVERRRLGWVAHSVLITRCADDALDLGSAVAGEPERARAVGAELARLHARGVEAAGAGLRLRLAPLALVAMAPEGASVGAGALPRTRAARDLHRLASQFGPTDRSAFYAGYREADSSRAWITGPIAAASPS